MTTYTTTFTTRDGFKVLEVFERVGVIMTRAILLPDSVSIEFDAASRHHADFVASHAQREVHTVDGFATRLATIGA
jgi:hypothetical protein